MLNTILKKVDDGISLTKNDAISLLNIDNFSADYYSLISKSNEQSRKKFNNKGYIFAQLGLNINSCSGNCKFCSIAKDNIKTEINFRKTDDEIIDLIKNMNFNEVSSVFLMTTEDFNKEDFLKIGAKVKKLLPLNIDLVANIGDFNFDYALKLKEIGFHAVYHIVRLREGVDTDISIDTRVNTLDAIYNAGLKLFYCIEPIGTEHTYEEIVDEMQRARDYKVDVMAVMGRISVMGTVFEHHVEVDDFELLKIVSVTNLFVNPKISMNIHEPKKVSLLGGVNQLYAEIGINPRDNNTNTENNRGLSAIEAKQLLDDAKYIVKT